MSKTAGGANGPSGILVVDKPPDITSAAVVGRVKRLLGVKKVGHAGTLDPFATGVLILGVNRATRLSRFFLHGRKTYAATLMLGTTTDTQDGTGAVLSRTPPEAIRFSGDEIREVLAGFRGEIDQLPPVYSALKHEGTPLYKLARRGAPVQKPSRRVTIEEIRATQIAPPEVQFTVTCSAGTYIRTLCADIGAALGCGGHLAALRRTGSGGFGIDEAIGLPELETAAETGRARDRLIPMADALRKIPAYDAGSGLAERIQHGRPLTAAEIPPAKPGADGFVKVVDGRDPGRLLAVVEWRPDEGRYAYCCVFHREPPSPASGRQPR